MKKALCSKLPAFGVLFLFTAILSLTSCENFLKSEQVKNDIISAIDYNNAKSYTIRVEAAKGSGVIRIPAEGTVSKKVTDTFIVKFEPDDSCKFTGWKAEIPGLKNGEKTSDYIDFEDPMALETKVTFKKAHDSIVLIPDCPQIPTATINLEGSHGKFSPAKGEMLVRQGFPFTISYEPDSDYDFIKWKIYDSVTGTEYNSNEYLQLTHQDREETECLLLNAPEVSTNIKLCLEPVIVKRPRVISATPQWDSLGSYRDARIQVIFDQTIDKNSIYYTDDEKTVLIAEGVTSFLPEETSKPNKYGYIKDGKQYYKNIQIDNQKTGESILECFGEPYFEDDITLIIPPLSDNPPPGNTKITVTLESGFSYENKKSVLLKEDYKWLYFVNSRTDNLAPTKVTENIMNVKGNASAALSVQEASPTILFDQKLQMEIKIEDQGSGPLGVFKLLFTDLNNTQTQIYKEIGFDSVEADNSALLGSSTELAEYKITDVPDGNYKLNVVYYDKNLNPTKAADMTDYYVTIDATKPVINDITFRTVSDSGSEANNKTAQSLSYTCSDANYDKVVVNYKPAGATAWEGTETFTDTNVNIIPNLTHGTDYQFEMVFYDKAENKTIKTATTRTELGLVQNAAVTTEQNQANTAANVHLTWEAPDGDFDSYEIEYKQKGVSGNAQTVSLTKTATSYDISDLPFALNYSFNIKTIQSGNTTKEQSLEALMPIHRIGIDSITIEYNANSPFLKVKSTNTGSTTYKAYLLVSDVSFEILGANNNSINVTNKNHVKDMELTPEKLTSPVYYQTLYDYQSELPTEISAPSGNKYFKFGQTYYFAIVITGSSQMSWSEIQDYKIEQTVDYLKMDSRTSTTCTVSWKYPWALNAQYISYVRLYLNDEEKKIFRNVYVNHGVGNGNHSTDSYTFEGLTADTNYTVRLDMTYDGYTSSKSLEIRTLPELQNFELDTSCGYGGYEWFDNNSYVYVNLKWDTPSIEVDRYVIMCKKDTDANYFYTNDDQGYAGNIYINGNWIAGIEGDQNTYKLQKYKASYYNTYQLLPNNNYEIQIIGYKLIDNVPVAVIYAYLQ